MTMSGVWFMGTAVAVVLYMILMLFAMRFILLRISEERTPWRRGYYKLLGVSSVINLVFCGAIVFALLQTLKHMEGW
jgi:ACR3 family arsenite efflux pump ArsB